MPEFLFQIKGKLGEPQEGFYGSNSNWSFPPVWQDKITADNPKHAKQLIEELYGKKFPLRVLAKDLDNNEFLLNIKEIKEDDYWTKKMFENNECLSCKGNFRLIEKYQLNSKFNNRDYCCQECKDEHYEKNRPANKLEYLEYNAIHDYVIYKITNKETGKCYIGQTKQAFTFRWYQHFYQSNDVKFHEVIKSFPITTWTFEVIEAIVIPDEIKYDKDLIRKFIFKKETDYIKQFDSLNNGYNSLVSIGTNESFDKNQLEIENMNDENNNEQINI